MKRRARIIHCIIDRRKVALAIVELRKVAKR